MSAPASRALRDAFGAFTTGVTVVTAAGDSGRPIGFTANSFTSVSLDPPLLLVCLAKSSRNYAAMTQARGFAVNVLSETQREISNTFARPVEDRFAGVEWHAGTSGAPILAGTAAWFDCERHDVVDAGDHVILLGRVVDFENSSRNGLGYARGSYFTPALEAKAARAGADSVTIAASVVERDGAVLLLADADGRWTLPEIAVEDGEPTEALARYLHGVTGLAATIGFLFSVFDDRFAGRQHVVYRAALAAGEPAAGRFFPADALPFGELASAQTADILGRFAAEAQIDAFGVYVGNETSGRVHALASKV
jgi:flavin-dependent trigonelline monooxygenase, reductase component